MLPEKREAALRRAAAPVHDADSRQPTNCIALCLSGGGYRAMLFHAGALQRLNELRWLSRIDRFSSVSGGSITAGLLAHEWDSLGFNSTGVAARYEELVLDKLYWLAGKTVDVRSIVLGVASPGSVGGRVARFYRRHLFGNATLQDVPGTPRFVFNTTSLQTGVLWRFSQPYAREYRVGKIPDPKIELAAVVAASSAFPPFLSPLVLRQPETAYDPQPDDDPLVAKSPFRTRLSLTDGGVYDNLGLETAWKGHRTVLISDGGGRIEDVARPRALWPFQLLRVLGVIDNQVRSLRKRQAIDAFEAGLRLGTYWGIRTDIADYAVGGKLPAPHDQTMKLARIKTRLGRLSPIERERLVNWGYAVCDAAMRCWVDDTQPHPTSFPYPNAGVG
jgi:NTE family protein